MAVLSLEPLTEDPARPGASPASSLESLFATGRSVNDAQLSTSVDGARPSIMEELLANVTNSVKASEAEVDPLTTLLPALLQIFTTIGLGWAVGSLQIFGPQEARGLGKFVGKISLPALILISLITLDLSEIKWSFLVAMLASKSLIFGLILLLDFCLNRDIQRAAIFAIYSTQTNDFGMGLPILNSVFGPSDPMVGLLYLVAPISLLILNPIGFVLLEVGKEKQGKDNGAWAAFFTVMKGLVTNPVIAMTVLGVMGNFAFKASPPPYLDHFFKALGNTFSALAPFSLGLSMVGKLEGIRGSSIKPIMALIAVKMIVTPRITYLLADQAALWIDGKPDRMISNFAFLLGSFPTALGVQSYAVEYLVCPDLVSAAIVLGTIASAPLMYGTASILTILAESPESLARAEQACILNCCIASIASILIVLAIFTYKRVLIRPPHLHTTIILVFTLVSATAGLLHRFHPIPSLEVAHLAALHASRLATPALALNLLCLVRGSSMSRLANGLLLLPGPLIALLTLLLLLAPYSTSHFLPFGSSQDELSLGIHCLALAPTLICLLLLSKEGSPSRESPGKEDSPGLPGVQIFRHTLLLLSMATAMFASIALSIGRLLLSESSYPGTFKVLIICNCIFSSGQGLFILAIFGMDAASKLFNPIRSLLDKLVTLSGRREVLVDAFFMPSVIHSVSTERLTKISEKIRDLKKMHV